MTDFPNVSALAGSPTESQFQAAITSFLNATKQIIGGDVAESVTLSSGGGVAPTKSIFDIDTYLSADTDDLVTIDPTNFRNGAVIALSSVASARTVVLKHNGIGSGKLILRHNLDVELTDPLMIVMLRYHQPSGTWREFCRNFGYFDITPTGNGGKFPRQRTDVKGIEYLSAAQMATALATMIQGRHTISIPAEGMAPRVSSGCGILTATQIAANQPDRRALPFPKSVTTYAEFKFIAPKSWDKGNLYARFHFTQGVNGTGNVIWGIQVVAIGDGQNIATNFGAAQELTVAATGVANQKRDTVLTSAIVPGAPVLPITADNCTIYVRVYRKGADASDTLAQDALLEAISLLYTTNAGNDA